MPISDEEIMRQLMSTFKGEAEEHVQNMNTLLLKLEKEKDADRTSRETTIQEIFREAHSLKGAARAVDATAIESISHGIENVFAAAKRQEIAASPALYDLLYAALDQVGSALEAVVEGKAVGQDSSDLIRRLDDAANNKSFAPETAGGAVPKPGAVKSKERGDGRGGAVEETIRVSTKKLDSLMTHVEELLVSKIRTEQRLAELKEVKNFLNDWQKTWFKARGEYDRLRRQREDGSLTEIFNFLSQNQQNLKLSWLKTNRLMQDFSKDTMRMSLVTEDLQEDIRRVRMLPVATIFDSFQRMVRDLSRDQGKQVDLVVEGAETELDKKVIEGIKDPLMHLLRNSIDHGVERPEARTNAGKSTGGTIWLRASNQGNNILIEVEDDGSGINFEKVKETALRKGLISQAEAKTISDDEAGFLIFRSGFSTADSVTNVSGRGVGLDVVKKNIEQLNGLVDVAKGACGGVKFSISLPLTLSTSRVLLVKTAGETFALPTSAVERIIRISKTEVFTVGTKETINIGNRSLSLVRLGEILELPAKASAGDDDKISVIILGAAEKRVAFAVDSLVGETEIVIKSLGKMLSRVRNVAGATILGNGKVVMILSISDLIKSSKTYGHYDAGATSKAQPAVKPGDLKTVLVVDDSITTRILEKNILETAGYTVCLANDGLEALETLKANRCDLIISDIDMPRMNGLDLTSKVKRNENLRDLPIILVTALDSDEDRERGLEAGADAYIVKHNFNQKNLLDTVEQLI